MGPANQSGSDQSTQYQARLESIVGRFEEAWQHGRRPVIDDYLPAAEPERSAALIELIYVDLEYRLKAGEAVRLESYLERFPLLANDHGTTLALIVAEYQLCQPREPDLTLEEYARRFPQYRAE